ncbi:LacI family DNA-binding transcriptional regulator [Flavobacterium cupreum]|uniref:LacI family DNA-binding transcriptional regulator n=2 Tax=Flavobacterium TaxID=237 RepID=A0A4Y7UD86_9FLAO|nr:MULTISPECIES: substrate-binding domain-containing protein [Flavobacterium]RUT67967.1 LacI family DNA-binding transcriptional regulator [Flavobacterium cupreum]TCN58992.1 LacI family transcriptional regulator [Flavobacterium circumlabens]TEB44395.1 LacI family DNA-binding transcriptional regulator [Flavobacterium circumlabens]
MKKNLTINEIAKIANVSRGTVDRVVNKRGYVAEDKQKQIEKIIKEYNFTPNTHARNLALSKSLKVAVILPEHKAGDYWEPIAKSTEMAGKNYLPFGLQISYYFYDQNNIDTFKDVEKKIFLEKNSAIITTQPQNPSIKAFLRKCVTKKIPFVLLGTNNTKYGALSNLGQDANQGGRLAGRLINYGQEHPAKYLIFNIFNEQNINPNVVSRIDGFKAYFKDNKKIKTELINININDAQLTAKITEKLMALTKSDGIFIPNSRAHMVAKLLNKDQKVRFLAFDLVTGNVPYLKAGVIDFLINQKPYEQGYRGVELLYRYLATFQQPDEVINIAAEVITIENLTSNEETSFEEENKSLK